MTKTNGGSVLIVGALGVVGRAALEAYEADAGWDVTGLSRRNPEFETRAAWINADLSEREGLAAGQRDTPIILLRHDAVVSPAAVTFDRTAGCRWICRRSSPVPPEGRQFHRCRGLRGSVDGA